MLVSNRSMPWSARLTMQFLRRPIVSRSTNVSWRTKKKKQLLKTYNNHSSKFKLLFIEIIVRTTVSIYEFLMRSSWLLCPQSLLLIYASPYCFNLLWMYLNTLYSTVLYVNYLLTSRYLKSFTDLAKTTAVVKNIVYRLVFRFRSSIKFPFRLCLRFSNRKR